MKLRTLNTSTLGALMLLSVASFTSCCDDNDWDVDGSHDRMFHTTSLSVDAKDDRVGVIFDKVPGAIGYQVEINRDTLYDEVELNANGNSIIQELQNSPDTIYDLEGSTKYFLRMRTLGENGKVSNWKYLAKYSFKTKSEQIITGIVPGPRTATVYFNGAKAIDRAFYYKSSEDSVRIDDAAIDTENGVINITGLKANTTYRVKLWNGENCRGNMSFKTTEDFPEGYDVISISAGDDLNAILAGAANDKVVILMAQGLEYFMPKAADGTYTTPVIPANITSVYFWGAAGEGQPVFHVRGINVTGNKDIVRFYNLKLVNDGPSADYVLNITGANDINKIQIDKCTVMDTRGVVRFQSIDGGTIGDITINNCIITNIGSYGVFNSKDQKNLHIGALNLTNSTVSGVVAGALINVHQSGMEINIDHCTIYNCVQATKSIIDVNKLTDIVPYISNTLIGPFNGSDGTKTIKGCSIKNQATINNTFYTSDQLWNSGFEFGNEISATAKDFWVDAENGDFTIAVAYRDTYGQYGDPRWAAE